MEKLPHKSRIGIWGYGITGKALVAFFHDKVCTLSLLEKKDLSPNDHAYLTEKNITVFCQERDQDAFFDHCDYVIPSPIIPWDALSENHRQKMVSEIDLFHAYAERPIIAITGTIGKTSITTFLSHILTAYGIPVLMGGNCEIPLFSLLDKQKAAHYFVVELSNLQLRYSTTFSPFIALLSNFFPNHLDWHSSKDDYFRAKCKIFAYQTPGSHALMPANLIDRVTRTISLASTIDHYDQNSHHAIDMHQLPAYSFKENWLAVMSIIKTMDLPITPFKKYADTCTPPAYRLQQIGIFNGITFYNDSKATIPESTYAALLSLQPIRPILILGGLSKGVNRSLLITQVTHTVKAIVCFGAERDQLFSWCQSHSILSFSCASLYDAFRKATACAVPGDTILFSPSGSSHDLFAHYKERGAAFDQLVKELEKLV